MGVIVVNLFGGPGSGKSTGAAYIFARLKMLGVNAELVTEYAKDKVWEGNYEAIGNQPYVFGKQAFRLSRCADKVDVIITDSPLLLSIIYNKNEMISRGLNQLVIDAFNSYENMSYFLHRTKPYNPVGRYQNEAESDEISIRVLDLLNEFGVTYQTVDGDINGYDKIVSDILDSIKEEKYECKEYNNEKNQKCSQNNSQSFC